MATYTDQFTPCDDNTNWVGGVYIGKLNHWVDAPIRPTKNRREFYSVVVVDVLFDGFDLLAPSDDRRSKS